MYLRTGRDRSGNPAEIEQALFREFRWWSLAEMKTSNQTFVPRDIAKHLEYLIKHGCPEAPAEVGE